MATKSWLDDVAACLDMMLAPNELFDAPRAYRAESVLRRMHPLFVGSIRERIDEQLRALREAGAVEFIGDGGVYRWLGLPEQLKEQPRVLGTRRAQRPPPAAPTPAPASGRTRPNKPGIDEFREQLRDKLAEASAEGKDKVSVAAFDLHRTLLAFPSPHHQMPACCRAMRAEMRGGDELLTQKDGPGLLIRYALPR